MPSGPPSTSSYTPLQYLTLACLIYKATNSHGVAVEAVKQPEPPGVEHGGSPRCIAGVRRKGSDPLDLPRPLAEPRLKLWPVACRLSEAVAFGLLLVYLAPRSAQVRQKEKKLGCHIKETRSRSPTVETGSNEEVSVVSNVHNKKVNHPLALLTESFVSASGSMHT